MKNPLISVLSISYNCESFLERSYKMLKNQTIADFEWVFVDDGSTDNTQKIIEHFKDERIKYYKLLNNSGRGVARNYAISQCSSDYISIWDLDDFYIKNRLELALFFFENGYESSTSSVFVVNEKLDILSFRLPTSVFPFFNKFLVPIHPTLNISKKLLLKFPYFQFKTVGGIGEDYHPLFATSLYSNCKIINEPTCFYFESREIFLQKALHSNIAGIKTALILLKNKSNSIKTRFALFNWIIKTSLKYILLSTFLISPKFYKITIKFRNSKKLTELEINKAKNLLIDLIK